MLITKSAEEIAELVSGRLVGTCANALQGVASLSEATETDVSFLGNEKYREQVKPSRAGVVLVPPDYEVEPPEGRAWIVCNAPSDAFTQVVLAFTPPPVNYAPGVHPTASIDPTATVPATAHVGACAVIDAGAVIGENTIIQANCYVGRETTIGDDCHLYPNVTIRERCILGNRIILHPGVVIGADGFGYKPTLMGHEKIPQVGIVQIDDDVEIGANSCVDRARFGRTWIRSGTKIDNLVQVAHNVEIGRACILVAQVGVAGSTHIGNGVVLAGQVGVSGHLRIGDGTVAMAKSGLTKDTLPGSVLIGSPARDRRTFARERMLTKHIDDLMAQVKELTKRLNALEGGSKA